MARVAKQKAKLYEVVDETFYPKMMKFGITMGYIMQVSEEAAVREFLTLYPKMKHGVEVAAIDCEMIGSDAVREGKKWLKENKK